VLVCILCVCYCTWHWLYVDLIICFDMGMVWDVLGLLCYALVSHSFVHIHLDIGMMFDLLLLLGYYLLAYYCLMCLACVYTLVCI
jgi:hypothetical protein